MYRSRDPQTSMFDTYHLLPLPKRDRLDRTWARAFRERCLPLIREDLFASLFDEGNGRPNKPVQIVVGVLILKEMFNLTDEAALEQLEFSLQWQYALRLTPEEACACQKTLHNFRVRLLASEVARLAFEETTAGIIKELGINTSRQRLDSTHVVSNIAVLTRLGLFCETTRVFLSGLRKKHPKHFRRLPPGLRGRYLKDDGEASGYGDARSSEARRRLDVCARDVYRLVAAFRGTAAAKMKEYEQLKRLLDEQCEIVGKTREPSPDDDDQGEGAVPVVVKEPKQISSASLQSPHDPDATYSGHKGKGYEVQVAETCHEENDVEIITHVEVTPACESDASVTIPVLKDLARRDLQPEEMTADTTYGSAANALEAERLGTELVSPVAGSGSHGDAASEDKEPPLSVGEFKIAAALDKPAVCPAGHEACQQERSSTNPDRIAITFAADTCDRCPFFERCPAQANREGTGYVLKVSLQTANIERRRLEEARGQFRERYAIRAGIEATNSELKRAHGLGHLRVRRLIRVRLSVYLKAIACNFKRMVRALMGREMALAAAQA